MDPISEFQGPTSSDYANVEALNSAFIQATSDMKPPQRGRLAAAPFLLFSLRERDLDWWDAALALSPQADLMASAELIDQSLAAIQVAALSFLWHLASRNPYAVRIVTGASLSWCDKITEQPLVALLDRVGTRSDLIRSRLDDERCGKLLGNASSSKRRVRRSLQLVVLQSMLTQAGFDHRPELPAAACSMPRSMRVQDKEL